MGDAGHEASHGHHRLVLSQFELETSLHFLRFLSRGDVLHRGDVAGAAAVFSGDRLHAETDPSRMAVRRQHSTFRGQLSIGMSIGAVPVVADLTAVVGMNCRQPSERVRGVRGEAGNGAPLLI